MDTIKSAGLRCDVLLTSEDGQAARAVAAEAHTYDVIFTLGGDGR